MSDLTKPALTVMIPAHNEAAYIQPCLRALYGSAPLPQLADGSAGVEVLLCANGCTDATVELARAVPVPDGWHLRVLERAVGNKLAALSEGDQQARAERLAYLDADVILAPELLPQLVQSLDPTQALHVSGSPKVSRATSATTRAYARIWQQTPFVTDGGPGFGIFAMTRKGRARWGDWPAIISDDTFARLTFTAPERKRLSATYEWPMVEGFRNLVRVRRRQDRGVSEIAAQFPALLQNDDPRRSTTRILLGLLPKDPIGVLVYITVGLAVRTSLFDTGNGWTRGR